MRGIARTCIHTQRIAYAAAQMQYNMNKKGLGRGSFLVRGQVLRHSMKYLIM